MTNSIDRRCPVCGWTGEDETICPECGHGTVAFDVTIHN